MESAGDGRMANVEGLLDDWDHMSEHFLPGRQLLLARAIRWLRHLDPAPAIIELGSGPGTTLRALRRNLPHAELAGVDSDPVLLHLHHIATPRSARIPVFNADLSDSGWTRAVALEPKPTVVVAVQVLHYFSPARFDQLLSEIRQLLEPGGVLIHLDHVPVAGLDTSSDAPIQPTPVHVTNVTDPWGRWWQAAANTPVLAEAFDRRSTHSGSDIGSAEYHPTERMLEEHLRAAGFRETVARRRHGTSLLTITGSARSSISSI